MNLDFYLLYLELVLYQVAPREPCESHLLLLGATSGAPLVVTHLVVLVLVVLVLVVTSCDNLNLNNSASFEPILLLFVSYGAPMWGILFFIIRFWKSKIFKEGVPKVWGRNKIEKRVQRLQFLSDFTRVCLKRCVLMAFKKRWEPIFDFRFWELLGGGKVKNHPKKIQKNGPARSIFVRFHSGLF